jgi:hypothetical protein
VPRLLLRFDHDQQRGVLQVSPFTMECCLASASFFGK